MQLYEVGSRSLSTCSGSGRQMIWQQVGNRFKMQNCYSDRAKCCIGLLKMQRWCLEASASSLFDLWPCRRRHWWRPKYPCFSSCLSFYAAFHKWHYVSQIAGFPFRAWEHPLFLRPWPTLLHRQILPIRKSSQENLLRLPNSSLFHWTKARLPFADHNQNTFITK